MPDQTQKPTQPQQTPSAQIAVGAVEAEASKTKTRLLSDAANFAKKYWYYIAGAFVVVLIGLYLK